MKRSKIRFYTDYTWSTLWWVSLLSVFAYVFLEWLFIITKPSVLSMLSFGEKFRVFLFAFSLVALMSYLFTKGMQGVFAVIRHKALKYLGLFLPTFTLSTLCLLLFDNFTYTLLGGGIATSSGLFTALYLLLYVDLLALVFLKLNQKLPSFEQFTALHRTKWAEPLSVLGLATLLLLTYQPPEVIQKPSINATNLAQPLPHILLITADGLEADHMSVYGYERDTTPNLRELAKVSLVAENHFTNNSYTPGAIVAILTGKHPTTTKVVYPPNILQSEDVYEHLPYILKQYGYINLQYPWPYYTEANTFCLLEGFDFVYGRTTNGNNCRSSLNRLFDSNITKFIQLLSSRVVERIRHLFFIQRMTNYKGIRPDYKEVILEMHRDGDKIDQVINNLTDVDGPKFIHLHWIGTHPVEDKFFPQVQVFTQGLDPYKQEEKDLNFYDDTIREFDAAIGEIIRHLKTEEIFDRTILIVTSDHGLWFSNLSRIPLIIHFPNNQHISRIKLLTQSIDIAPTILDYLNIQIPEWMEGTSLLADNLVSRNIFSVGPAKIRANQKILYEVEIKPPFFSVGSLTLISCNSWYRLDLSQKIFESGKVTGSTNTCAPIDEGQAFDAIIQHLRERGFDTSSVEDFSQIKRASP